MQSARRLGWLGDQDAEIVRAEGAEVVGVVTVVGILSFVMQVLQWLKVI